jgi:hypothetical protein
MAVDFICSTYLASYPIWRSEAEVCLVSLKIAVLLTRRGERNNQSLDDEMGRIGP